MITSVTQPAAPSQHCPAIQSAVHASVGAGLCPGLSCYFAERGCLPNIKASLSSESWDEEWGGWGAGRCSGQGGTRKNHHLHLLKQGCLCPNLTWIFLNMAVRVPARPSARLQSPSANPCTLFSGALTPEHLPLPRTNKAEAQGLAVDVNC